MGRGGASETIPRLVAPPLTLALTWPVKLPAREALSVYP